MPAARPFQIHATYIKQHKHPHLSYGCVAHSQTRVVFRKRKHIKTHKQPDRRARYTISCPCSRWLCKRNEKKFRITIKQIKKYKKNKFCREDLFTHKHIISNTHKYTLNASSPQEITTRCESGRTMTNIHTYTYVWEYAVYMKSECGLVCGLWFVGRCTRDRSAHSPRRNTRRVAQHAGIKRTRLVRCIQTDQYNDITNNRTITYSKEWIPKRYIYIYRVWVLRLGNMYGVLAGRSSVCGDELKIESIYSIPNQPYELFQVNITTSLTNTVSSNFLRTIELW